MYTYNIIQPSILFKRLFNTFFYYQNNIKITNIQNITLNLSIPSLNPFQKLINQAILQLNRNGRIPKRANHGARPCSSVLRRARKKQYYRRWNQKTPADLQQITSKK